MDNPAQEQYYEDVHLATTPFRWAFSVLQTVVMVILGIVGGIGYPLYLLVSGQHVSLVSLVVASLVILTVFTLFYAPIYLTIGGIVFAYLLAHLADTHENFVVHLIAGWNTAFLIFGFLVVGILQRFIRNFISRPAPVKRRRTFSLFDRSDRIARHMGHMGPLQFQTMRNLYGDDFTKWPIN